VAAGGPTHIVLIAMGGNFGLACAKFAAAAWTGSSAMACEAVHSLLDASHQGLLLYGLKTSSRLADRRQPFSCSKELYFWSFVVGILLFALGAGVSIYMGVERVFWPRPITDAQIIYFVLGVGLLLTGYSTYKAVAEFSARHQGKGWFSGLRQSKDPVLLAIGLEGMAALAGLLVAMAGVFTADQFGYKRADGVASILIGLVLAGVAICMAIRMKALLAVAAVDPDVRDGLERLFAEETGAGRAIRGKYPQVRQLSVDGPSAPTNRQERAGAFVREENSGLLRRPRSSEERTTGQLAASGAEGIEDEPESTLGAPVASRDENGASLSAEPPARVAAGSSAKPQAVTHQTSNDPALVPDLASRPKGRKGRKRSRKKKAKARPGA